MTLFIVIFESFPLIVMTFSDFLVVVARVIARKVRNKGRKRRSKQLPLTEYCLGHNGTLQPARGALLWKGGAQMLVNKALRIGRQFLSAM